MDAAHSTAVQVTDQNFAEEIEKFPGIALVDFWAVWCGPCQVMSPLVEELAEKYAGNPHIKIAQLNTDENQETSAKHSVLSIPSFKFFTAGKVVDPRADTIIGVNPIEALDAKIQELLKNLPAEEKATA